MGPFKFKGLDFFTSFFNKASLFSSSEYVPDFTSRRQESISLCFIRGNLLNCCLRTKTYIVLVCLVTSCDLLIKIQLYFYIKNSLLGVCV